MSEFLKQFFSPIFSWTCLKIVFLGRNSTKCVYIMPRYKSSDAFSFSKFVNFEGCRSLNLLLITHDIFTSTWQICIILSKQDIHIYWPMMSPWIWKKWWFEIHEINTLEINIDILFSFGFNNVDFTSAKIVKICIKCSNLRCMELNEKKLMG